jgi:multidrug efflux pump
MAQVDVQNRIKTVEPRLPAAVRQNGLRLESAASSFLMIVSAQSTDGQYDEVALSDHLARNVVEELRRIEGVGRVQLFGAERAMRIWVDPARLLSYKLSMGDLSDAVARQNVQIAPGQVGGAPTVEGQRVTVPVTVRGNCRHPPSLPPSS